MTDEQRYMQHLDEVYDIPGYGLLLSKGDPIAFEVGLNEWTREESND